MAVPVIFKGQYFPSKQALFRHYSITAQTVKNLQYQKGLTFEHAVESAINGKTKKVDSRAIFYKGQRFKSKNQLLRHLGISSGGVYVYEKQGYSFLEGVDIILRKKENRRIEYDGKIFDSLRQLARAYNLDEYMLRKRLREDKLPLEQAMSLTAKTRQVTVFGRVYDSVIKVSEHYGVHYSALCDYLYKFQDIERALLEVLAKEPILFEGVKYETFSTLCAKYNMDSTVARQRLKIGHTLYDAVTVPVKKLKKSEPYQFRGKLYNSKREAANDYGISFDYLTTIVKSRGIDFFITLDLVEKFVSNLRGDKPSLIIKLPAFIYGDTWYYRQEDFFNAINIGVSKGKNYLKTNGDLTYHQALIRMQNHTHIVHFDAKTKERINYRKAYDKYNAKGQTLVDEGILIRKEVLLYPEMRFDKTLYFASPAKDFSEYLKAYVAKK